MSYRIRVSCVIGMSPPCASKYPDPTKSLVEVAGVDIPIIGAGIPIGIDIGILLELTD